MQHHTVQQLDAGPRAGKFVYTGGNRRMGRYIECCSEPRSEISQLPADERDTSKVWDRIGHDTEAEAYTHMREQLLKKLRLDVQFGDWSGCRAPGDDGQCDTPTKGGAEIPPIHFTEPLCDQHRTRETVEAMWDGPGDWSGSW
jgi:hypothetical protein